MDIAVIGAPDPDFGEQDKAWFIRPTWASPVWNSRLN